MIEDFREEYQKYSDFDNNLKENDLPINNKIRVEELINEKKKISGAFTSYIIERCKPSEVAPLRRLVEGYENNVEIITKDILTNEDYYDIRDITVIFDILFGLDVTYLSNLFRLIQEGQMERIADYLEDNISSNLSYEDLLKIKRGYSKKR